MRDKTHNITERYKINHQLLSKEEDTTSQFFTVLIEELEGKIASRRQARNLKKIIDNPELKLKVTAAYYTLHDESLFDNLSIHTVQNIFLRTFNTHDITQVQECLTRELITLYESQDDLNQRMSFRFFNSDRNQLSDKENHYTPTIKTN